MKTNELINEVISLPVEERALIIDCLLRSLNAPQSEIDKQWLSVAKKRLIEMRSGKTKLVSGEEVFNKIRNRLAQ